jgi:hypothetical protein
MQPFVSGRQTDLQCGRGQLCLLICRRSGRRQSVPLETPIQSAPAFSFVAPATAPANQPTLRRATEPTPPRRQNLSSPIPPQPSQQVMPQGDPSSHDVEVDGRASSAAVATLVSHKPAVEPAAAVGEAAQGTPQLECNAGTSPADELGTAKIMPQPISNPRERHRPLAVLALPRLQIPSQEEVDSPHSLDDFEACYQLQSCATPEPAPSCAEEAFPQPITSPSAVTARAEVPNPSSLSCHTGQVRHAREAPVVCLSQ